MHFWNVLYAHGEPVAIIDLDFLQYGILLFDLAYAARWLKCWKKNGLASGVGSLNVIFRPTNEGEGDR